MLRENYRHTPIFCRIMVPTSSQTAGKFDCKYLGIIPEFMVKCRS